MERENDGDGYVLSTGRRFYANRGLIGINPEMEVSEGYDGHIHYGPIFYPQEAPGWSKEERAELADFMIALWSRFKASV